MPEVPARITLRLLSPFNPNDDLVGLAATLYHAGLIHRSFSERTPEGSPNLLEIDCTFADEYSLAKWRAHPLVRERYALELATKLVEPPSATRYRDRYPSSEKACNCPHPPGWILRGRGFGHRGPILWCGACLGYLPPYHLTEWKWLDHKALESWAVLTEHIYDIWFIGAGWSEGWALAQLAGPDSELNREGRRLARTLNDKLGMPVWYYLFVPNDAKSEICPACDAPAIATGGRPRWQCAPCGIVF